MSDLRVNYIKKFCEALKECREGLNLTDLHIYCILNQAEITAKDLIYAEETEFEIIMRKAVHFVPVKELRERRKEW